MAMAWPCDAQEPLPAPAASTPAAVSSVALDLAQCLHVALHRQPRVAAQRASLAAAEAGSRGLEALRIPTALDHEIPIRRQQAALGITAAAAALDQAERETVYAVTRSYFTVVYAREQERIARSVVERLGAVRDTAKRQLDAGARDVTSSDVQRTTVYLRLAETKRLQATQGVRRALAALREAVGLGCDVAPLDVPAGPLPEPDARPNEDEIIAAALARRGELVRAKVFADVTCLEVEAQGTSMHPKMATFAAGSDIHGLQVPQGVHNHDYRPGAVPPEMPTLLAGPRPERVQRARALHARAAAVVEVTRNLIVLEAEDAYLRWEEAVREAAKAREAADTGDQWANDVSKDFTAGLKVKVEEVINARVLASQARAQYHEFLYRQILALAELERVTGGGFCAGLTEAARSR
jgi:outer membrane protein TolC